MENRSQELQAYAEQLLRQQDFYSYQEKAWLRHELRLVLRCLLRIDASLSQLLKQYHCAQVENSEEQQLSRLIRRVRNRLKVLPMEPVLSDVSPVALHPAKSKLAMSPCLQPVNVNE